MWGGHIVVGERAGNGVFARWDWEQLDARISELGSGPDVVSHPHEMALAELRGDLNRAVALLPDPETAGSIPGYLGYIHGVRTRVLHNAGRVTEARRELGEWYRAFDVQPGMRRGGYVGPSTLAEIDTALAALGDEAACRDLYAELEARPWARFGGRGYDVIRGSLAERLDMPGEAEGHYLAGRDWAARERLPVEEGRCVLGQSRLARAAGNLRSARASLPSRHGTLHCAESRALCGGGEGP